MQSVGVLALQGSFSEHLTKLAQLTEVKALLSADFYSERDCLSF